MECHERVFKRKVEVDSFRFRRCHSGSCMKLSLGIRRIPREPKEILSEEIMVAWTRIVRAEITKESRIQDVF